MRGMRTLARITRTTSSIGTPSRQSRIHGSRSPSWKTSVLSHALVPGQPAADVAVVRDRHRVADVRVAVEDRLDDVDVGRVHAAVERVVHHEHVAGVQVVAEAPEQRAHRGRDRAEVERDRDRLRHRLAASGRRARPRSPSRRARPSSARCGRSWSPSRRRSTRTRCRRSPARSRRRGRRRGRVGSATAAVSVSTPPAPRCTVQPGGTTTVVSYSSIEQRARAAAPSPISSRETTGVSIAPCASPKSASRVAAVARLRRRRAARCSRAAGPSSAEPQRADLDRRALLVAHAVDALVLGLEARRERRDRRRRRSRRRGSRPRCPSSGRRSGGRPCAATRPRRPSRRCRPSRISASRPRSVSSAGLVGARRGRSARRGTRCARTAARPPRTGRRAAARPPCARRARPRGPAAWTGPEPP